MESKTKIDLSETRISALLRQHFGSNSDLAASQPLKDGWFNSAYHLPLHTWIKTYIYQILKQSLRELEIKIE